MTDINELINIITRQTDLSHEDAKNKLENNNGNYIKVLEEYYGIIKKQDKCLTINQQIYKEIRHVMDNASHRFYNQKE